MGAVYLSAVTPQHVLFVMGGTADAIGARLGGERQGREGARGHCVRSKRYDSANVSIAGLTGGLASTLLLVTKRQFT